MCTREILQKFFGNICDGVTRKKVLLDDYSEKGKLKKCLKTFDLIAIGVSCTLGSGVYVLTGEVAKHLTGPAIILSFLIAAIASILSGLCYAEFATKIPKSGSAYVYTYVTIGEFAAFFIGWNLLLEYIIGSAVVARAFSAYLNDMSGGIIYNATQNALGTLNIHGFGRQLDFLSFTVVLLFSILLSTGVKNSSVINNILTVINVGVAIFVVCAGASYSEWKNWNDFAPFGAQGIVAGASTCFFSFIGFDVIATTAEEASNPSKSIPRSIIGTIAICFSIYFLMSTVITLMVPYQNLHVETAVSNAFSQVNAKWAGYVVSVGAGVSMLGCTLVSLFPLPRLLLAMSDDGLIPKFFSKIATRTNSPVISTLIGGICTGTIAMLFDIQELVEMLSIGTLLAYTMVDLCVIKLRYEVNIVDDVLLKEKKNPPSNNWMENKKEDNPSLQVNQRINEKQNRTVFICLFIIIVAFIAIASVSVFNQSLNPILKWVIVVSGAIASIVATTYVYKLPQSDKDSTFKVPFVPFLPIAAVFMNVYLMVELRRLTWLRVIVWMSIGLVIYFGYSMRHSVTKEHKRRKSDEHEPLIWTTPVAKDKR